MNLSFLKKYCASKLVEPKLKWVSLVQQVEVYGGKAREK